MSVVGGPRPESIFNRFSFEFDGTDDFVNCGNTGLLNGGTELTMSGWFKTTDKTLTQILFSTFAGKTYAEMSLISGGLYCWIGDGVSTSNYNIVNAANLSISNDNWFHLTMVFDGSQSTNDTRLKVYKNGNPLTWTTVRTIPTTLGTSTASTYIGARNTANVFSGNIDEVVFWHSLPNVTDIYTGTIATDLSALNPISWWRMGDEATYSNPGGVGNWTLVDQGSGGNNGTSDGMDENNRVLDTP
tara:strand:- start:3278 stop:4009 length:732 start_codon:yes stop_codon:yes gene_type:complete